MVRKWIVPIASTLLVLGPGAIYAYGLLSEPLIAAFGWKAAQVNWALALALFFVGVGAVVAGLLLDRVGPTWVAWTGVLLWGGGNVLTGAMAPHGLLWLMLGFGVLGGLGCGMAYTVAMCTAVRAMPARRGLAAGLVTMGFGLGAVVYEAILRRVPGFDKLLESAAEFGDQQARAAAVHAPFNDAAYALSAGATSTLLTILIFSGMAFVVLGAACAVNLRGVKANAGDGASHSPGAMLLSPQFYLLWVTLFLNVVAGIVVLGNGVEIMRELTGQGVLATSQWFMLVLFLNGAGAVLWGAVSDRYGRRVPFALLFIIEAVGFFCVGRLHSLAAVSIALGIVALCYSGGFTLAAAALADLFGLSAFGSNLGILLSAWGCAGLVGTWFASAVKELTGSYASAVEPAALLLIIAIVFPLVLDSRPVPQKPPEPVAST